MQHDPFVWSTYTTILFGPGGLSTKSMWMRWSLKIQLCKRTSMVGSQWVSPNMVGGLNVSKRLRLLVDGQPNPSMPIMVEHKCREYSNLENKQLWFNPKTFEHFYIVTVLGTYMIAPNPVYNHWVGIPTWGWRLISVAGDQLGSENQPVQSSLLRM